MCILLPARPILSLQYHTITLYIIIAIIIVKISIEYYYGLKIDTYYIDTCNITTNFIILYFNKFICYACRCNGLSKFGLNGLRTIYFITLLEPQWDSFKNLVFTYRLKIFMMNSYEIYNCDEYR